MTPEQFVRVLAKCDIKGYDWLNSVTKFDLPNLNGETFGSSEWFGEQNLRFWYSTEVITRGNECRIDFNVYETSKPGTSVKRDNGSDFWFTTAAIPKDYFEISKLLSDGVVDQQAGYVIANYALQTAFAVPPMKWTTVVRKKNTRQKQESFSELCLL
jgi:hypothetical protein